MEVVLAFGSVIGFLTWLFWPRGTGPIVGPNDPPFVPVPPPGPIDPIDIDPKPPAPAPTPAPTPTPLPAPKPFDPTPAEPDPANARTMPTAGEYYQIKSGDTLSKIALLVYNVPSLWVHIKNHSRNAWIPPHATAGLLLNPAYRDPRWNVPAYSGHKFPIVFIPSFEYMESHVG